MRPLALQFRSAYELLLLNHNILFSSFFRFASQSIDYTKFFPNTRINSLNDEDATARHYRHVQLFKQHVNAFVMTLRLLLYHRSTNRRCSSGLFCEALLSAEVGRHLGTFNLVGSASSRFPFRFADEFHGLMAPGSVCACSRVRRPAATLETQREGKLFIFI